MYLEGHNRRFGFGLMRLPMDGERIDIEELKRMVDLFLEKGFRYFDTAHGYHGGKSELAIKEALTSRYPREAYSLTNKLTEPYFHSQEDIVPFFHSQLEACGVEYFDYYLMHAQNARNFEHFRRCKAYETAFELKRQGLIRHVGISFHDSSEVLERILNTYPEIEVVQIQFNYLDYDSPTVESKRCYDICAAHGKPVIVMEPVKGGSLVNLPDNGKAEFDRLNGGSYASYAIRFVLHQPQVAMVLSGMSNLAQMEDNLSFTKEEKPLSEKELEAIWNVRDILTSLGSIPCTHCRYCVDENHCPMGIAIPDIFAAYNAFKTFHDWNAKRYNNETLAIRGEGRACDCIGCGGCERVCPQGLKIRDLLAQIAEEFK